MSKLESLSLSDAPLAKVKVNATVIFSILNSFSRRTSRDSRVIGTLLGNVEKDGTIVVSKKKKKLCCVCCVCCEWCSGYIATPFSADRSVRVCIPSFM